MGQAVAAQGSPMSRCLRAPPTSGCFTWNIARRSTAFFWAQAAAEKH